MSLLIHTCAACGGTSPPTEADPDGWARWDGGTRLLCSGCSAFRRGRGAGDLRMLDKEFVARVGMTLEATETPQPQTICGGCKRPFPTSMGDEFCPTCAARRRTPRHYQPVELRAAGMDPATALTEGKSEPSTEPKVEHPRRVEWLAREAARVAGWTKK